MSSSKLQLLSGPSVDDALQETAVRRLIRYRLNPATIGILLIFGGLSFVAAGYLWFGPGLGGGYTAGFIATLLLGMTFFSMAAFWGNFQNNSFVAISDDYLFVGQNEQAWRIDWSLIDREALNFDDMTTSRFRGVMTLDVGGQEIEIPLYTPFAIIEDYQALMSEFLHHLKATEDSDEDGSREETVDEAGDDTDE